MPKSTIIYRSKPKKQFRNMAIFNNAETCNDHYHVISTLNKAVDEVRRADQAQMTNQEDRERFCRTTRSRLEPIRKTAKTLIISTLSDAGKDEPGGYPDGNNVNRNMSK